MQAGWFYSSKSCSIVHPTGIQLSTYQQGAGNVEDTVSPCMLQGRGWCRRGYCCPRLPGNDEQPVTRQQQEPVPVQVLPVMAPKGASVCCMSAVLAAAHNKM